LEAPDLGNEDGVVPPEGKPPGKPTSRRYSPEEKVAAMRMVPKLGVESGAA